MQIKNIPKVLWNFSCIVIIISTIVLLSKFSHEASYLRKWRNETNNFLPLLSKLNKANYKKFLEFLNSNSTESTANELIYNISSSTTGSGIHEANNKDEDNKEEDNKRNNEQCRPEPPRGDFSKCGSRLADRKCCEYIWAWKYKAELIERSECISGYGIIGGSKVEHGAFPHMVALGFKRKNVKSSKKTRPQYDYMCGGSLISEQFVLTAGHCTSLGASKTHEILPAVVAMGGEVLSQNMTIVIIDKIIKHQKYLPPKLYYDVALLKLREKVRFTNLIHPACVSTDLQPQNIKVNVTGWGTTDRDDATRMNDHLLVATVDIIGRDTCRPIVNRIYQSRKFTTLKYHQICAGVSSGEMDTCRGDSGGPLQVRINTTYGNIHRVIGVTSFGNGCGSSVPSVYTSVSSVVTWIEKIVWSVYKKNYYEGMGFR